MRYGQDRRQGRRGGHRRMYNLTGLPGWIRFGFSPGWAGENPQNLPPTAQWIQQTGLMEQYLDWLSQSGIQPDMQPVDESSQWIPPDSPNQNPVSKEEEKTFLEQQSKILRAELESLKKRLNNLIDEE